MSKRYCMNCGHEIAEDARFCSGCGMEVNEEMNETTDSTVTSETLPLAEEEDNRDHSAQGPGDLSHASMEQEEGVEAALQAKDVGKEEDTQQPLGSGAAKKSSKNKVILIGILALLVLGCIIGGVNIKKQKDRERALAAAELKKNQEIKAIDEYNEYIAKFNTIETKSINGIIDAEEVCLLTYNVWSDKIFDESTDETAKYLENTYDFNEAIQNVYSDEEIIKKLEGVEETQTTISTMMKELQSTPKELEKCYELAMEVNSTYSLFAGLALNPSGTMDEYRQSEQEKVEAFISAYKMYIAVIPEKKMYTDDKGKPENEFEPYRFYMDQNVTVLPDEIETTESDDAVGMVSHDEEIGGIPGKMTYSYDPYSTVIWFESWSADKKKEKMTEDKVKGLLKKLENAYGKPKKTEKDGNIAYSWKDGCSIILQTNKDYSILKMSWMSLHI